MKITNLQINHLTNPIGIDGRNMRLSWNLAGSGRQKEFEVTVSDHENKVLESIHRNDDSMVYVLRKEIPWKSKVNITLKVWDEENAESDPASIMVITGIAPKDWRAKWINPELNSEQLKLRRASYLMKKFTLSKIQIDAAKAQGAFLFSTCHGIMNIYMNGRDITNRQFMPGTQQYDKRLMVETIEVDSFLKEGENEILVSIGDGWYRGSMGMAQTKNVYGSDTALLMQMEIAGSIILITDESWAASQDGPIGLNDFMAGEDYDATKEFWKDGNLTKDISERFHPVKVEKFGIENLISTDTVPMIPHEIFTARKIVTPGSDVVLDFGQNIVGYVEFDFSAQEGEKVTLIHGETLDLEGNFTIENFQTAKQAVKQQIDYICKAGRNKYHPTKTYMGFRYVKVIADFEIKPEAFKAIAVYSDIRTTAAFTCGVPEVNQLFENALWSMKGNFVDVPTDCPTREKSGYSGDCQAYIHTAMYLMDCYPVYAKWIREQAAGQYHDGVVPQIAPKQNPPGKKEKMGGLLAMDGGIGWSDSFEIIPYRLMKRYGDETLIHENYEAMKKWTEYEIKRARKTRFTNRKILPREHRKYMIDKGWMWGEWLEPGQDVVNYMKNLVTKGDPEVGTAFLFMNLKYMEQMAEKLGKTSDQARYQAAAARVKEAYRAVYLDHGSVTEKERQCRFVRPIAHDLLTEEEKLQAASDLADLIAKNQDHLNTGFLTTHELNRTLSRYGQNPKAYDLLLQKDKPGWLFAVTKGCTTIPENWNCYTDDGRPVDSFNHYSYGAIAGWLMDCVCGINVEDGRIVIQPYPDARLGFANAAYDSPYGRIVSQWKYVENEIMYHIEIPANMSAEIRIAGMEAQMVESGTYHYRMQE